MAPRKCLCEAFEKALFFSAPGPRSLFACSWSPARLFLTLRGLSDIQKSFRPGAEGTEVFFSERHPCHCGSTRRDVGDRNELHDMGHANGDFLHAPRRFSGRNDFTKRKKFHFVLYSIPSCVSTIKNSITCSYCSPMMPFRDQFGSLGICEPISWAFFRISDSAFDSHSPTSHSVHSGYEEQHCIFSCNLMLLKIMFQIFGLRLHLGRESIWLLLMLEEVIWDIAET